MVAHLKMMPRDPKLSKTELLSRIIHNVRESLELPDILSATVREVRDFLAIDRVMIYQFDEEGHGQVVAEALKPNRLPSLLGLTFPAQDIPQAARELFCKARVRTIVDLGQQMLSASYPHSPHLTPLTSELVRLTPVADLIQRPVDPCHALYMRCMGVHASMVVPLLHQNQLWGLLIAHHGDPYAFAQEDLQIVQMVADQMTIAIAQADLLSQTRAKAERETLLNQITTLLHSPLHPESVLPSVLQTITQALQGIGARLYIQAHPYHEQHFLPPSSKTAGYLCCYGVQPSLPSQADPQWLEESPFWQQFLHPNSSLWLELPQEGSLLPPFLPPLREMADYGQVTDIYQEPQLFPLLTPFASSTIRGLLIIPFSHRGQTLGCITLFRQAVDTETLWAGYRDPDPRQQQPRLSFNVWRELKLNQAPQWTKGEIELLHSLGIHIALAMMQNQLYQQVHLLNSQLEAQVEERTAELQKALDFEAIVRQVTDKLRDSLDESQILGVAVRELAAGLHVDCCDISLYNFSTGKAVIQYEYTQSIPSIGGLIISMDDYPEFYHLLREGQYFQCCDLGMTPRRDGVSMLVCPLLDDQGILGDLWLVNQSDRAFDHLEIRLVQQIANHCAIAIRQAWLYQTAQNQVEVLERLNRLKDEFLSTVSHELRTPISNMKMALRMLRLDVSPEKQEIYLNILEQECQRENEMIEDLLDLQRLEGDNRDLALEPLAIQAWLPPLLQSFQTRMQSRQQRLSLTLDPRLSHILTERTSLERVVSELVNNACKYAPPQAEIRVGTSQDSSHIILTIQNTGTHIPPQEISRIFQKFYRIPQGDPWKQGGTGLGLALVKKLVEHLQGEISVESQDQLTTFTVRIPRTYAQPTST